MQSIPVKATMLLKNDACPRFLCQPGNMNFMVHNAYRFFVRSIVVAACVACVAGKAGAGEAQDRAVAEIIMLGGSISLVPGPGLGGDRAGEPQGTRLAATEEID
jgi:hypothetical protein